MGLVVGRVTRDQEILGSISLHSKLFSIEPANLKFVRYQCSQRKNGETMTSCFDQHSLGTKIFSQFNPSEL